MFCTACAQPLDPPSPICARCGSLVRNAESTRRARRKHSGTVRLLEVGPLVALLVLASLGTHRALDREGRRADAYAAGHRALAAGALVEASGEFAAAGGYADAPAMLALTRDELRPLAIAYESGAAALRDGDLDGAIAALLPVAVSEPDYADATELLAQARERRNAAALADADRAASGGDWSGAERNLAGLLALDPGNEDAVARLAAVRAANPVYLVTSGRNLQVVPLEGGEPSVLVDTVPVAWPVWSPDRSLIAFVSPESTGRERALYVVVADGGEPRRIAEGPARYRPPVWSPDGRRIAFEVEGPTAENASGRETVMVADLEAGTVADVVPAGFPNGGSPTWSPEGDRLAFVVRGGPAAGSGMIPGGGSIASGTAIYVMDLATGAARRASGADLPFPWRIAWSPTAERIVVFSRPDGTPFRQGTIELLDLATGVSEPVDDASTEVSLPVWAPDGHAFAYVAGGKTVRIVGMDGLHQAVPGPDTLAGFVTWAPTSDRLLALGPSGEASSLLVALDGPVATGTAVTVTYDGGGGDPGPAQWSPLHSPGARADTGGGTALDGG